MANSQNTGRKIRSFRRRAKMTSAGGIATYASPIAASETASSHTSAGPDDRGSPKTLSSQSVVEASMWCGLVLARRQQAGWAAPR